MATKTTTTPKQDGSAANPFLLYKGKNFGFIVRVPKQDGSGGEQDLAGYTGRAQMRPSVDHVGPPTTTFTVTNHPTERGRADVTLGANLSQTGGDAGAGQDDIVIGDYVTDVEFENDVDPTDVINGGFAHIRVKGEVTK